MADQDRSQRQRERLIIVNKEDEFAEPSFDLEQKDLEELMAIRKKYSADSVFWKGDIEDNPQNARDFRREQELLVKSSRNKDEQMRKKLERKELTKLEIDLYYGSDGYGSIPMGGGGE